MNDMLGAITQPSIRNTLNKKNTCVLALIFFV